MSYFVFRMTVQNYNLVWGDCRGMMSLVENSEYCRELSVF